MICVTCNQSIEPGQLYHYAIRATPEIEGGTVRVVVGDQPVHEYPCPIRCEIVDGHLMIAGVDMGDVRAAPPSVGHPQEWIDKRVAKVKAYPAGTVLKWHDGSIAYRTTKPGDDHEAWLIIRTDGTSVGAGYITVDELDPLYHWSLMEAAS